MPTSMRPIARSALLLLPLLLGGCFERAQATVEQTVRPVLATKVQAAQETAPRHYPGLVKPRREADIGFRAAGRIVAREVDVGARVAAGPGIARLDDADIALGVRAAEADLALARNKLENTVLKAPSAGVVTAVLADRGTVVAEGAPVLRLAESDSLEVEVQLPETALAEVQGAAAQVALWARPEAPVPATLRELAAAATPGLRTYAARFTLAAPPPWLAIGMSATLTLQAKLPDGLAALPAAALADRGQGPIVWVIDGTTVTARPVKIVALRQDRALVTGVAPGETIVALGGHKLDPAAKVRIASLGE